MRLKSFGVSLNLLHESDTESRDITVTLRFRQGFSKNVLVHRENATKS